MHIRTLSTATVAAVVSAVILLPACGADKATHADFSAKVKSICAASSKRHQAVAPDFDFKSFDPRTSDLSTIVPVIEGHLAISRETVAQLAKVDGPEADVKALSNHMALADRLHDLATKEIAAAKAGDRDKFMSLTSKEEALQSQGDPKDPAANC